MIHNSKGMEVYGSEPDRAWVLRNEAVTPSGRRFTGPADMTACGPEAGHATCERWLDSQHLTQRLAYVPDNRFWTLQWRELGVLIAISLLLAGFCGWWIRHRSN
jgi:hypothetical protein